MNEYLVEVAPAISAELEALHDIAGQLRRIADKFEKDWNGMEK